MTSDYIYAVVDATGKVSNMVIADNADATGMLHSLIPEAADIILTTDETRPAFIGGDILDGKFRPPPTFPSWVWDKKSWSWVAPVPYPEGGNGYTWDEETVSWVEIPPMEPAPPVE